MTPTLATPRSERSELEERQAALVADRTAAKHRLADAREFLADGSGRPEVVSEAQNAIAAIISALGVISGRIAAVDAEAAPIEAAARCSPCEPKRRGI
jgi:hypothetical protein